MLWLFLIAGTIVAFSVPCIIGWAILTRISPVFRNIVVGCIVGYILILTVGVIYLIVSEKNEKKKSSEDEKLE